MPALQVFISYSHADAELRHALGQHLAPLLRRRIVRAWYDGLIKPGDDWEAAIHRKLEHSDVVLLLISADFIASRYCHEVEMRRALARHEAGNSRVVPILLRPVDWPNCPFAKLQRLPGNGVPVTSWPDRDEALVDVVRGIRDVVESIGGPRLRSDDDPAPLDTVGLEAIGDQASATLVATKRARLEIVIDRPFTSYTDEDQSRLIDAIKLLLGTGSELRVVHRIQGSVRLLLELATSDAARLLEAHVRGNLTQHGIVGVEEFPARGGESGRFSDFAVLQTLGTGAFGSVVIAEQWHPVRRTVALKVLSEHPDSNPDFETRRLQRFRLQAEILGVLHHDHVVRLLDADTSGHGTPYLAMELVRGDTITRYCQEHRLSVSDRLRLFVQLCSAVQHVHDCGILHRNLKPGNILVAAHPHEPSVKLIDFGLAKTLPRWSGTSSPEEDEGSIVGTPAYMSPEQARGTPTPDARLDVYALGCVLYELLIDEPPRPATWLRAEGMQEMLLRICEHDPPSPSRKLSLSGRAVEAAAQRRSSSRALLRVLRTDLDWIARRATARNPAHRYSSAEALGEDVRRHLNGHPVAARPKTWLYTASKFASRHRSGLWAVAAAAGGALVGFALGRVL